MHRVGAEVVLGQGSTPSARQLGRDFGSRVFRNSGHAFLRSSIRTHGAMQPAQMGPRSCWEGTGRLAAVAVAVARYRAHRTIGRNRAAPDASRQRSMRRRLLRALPQGWTGSVPAVVGGCRAFRTTDRFPCRKDPNRWRASDQHLGPQHGPCPADSEIWDEVVR